VQATLFAGAMVVVFMIVYYRMSGVIAALRWCQSIVFDRSAFA